MARGVGVGVVVVVVWPGWCTVTVLVRECVVVEKVVAVECVVESVWVCSAWVVCSVMDPAEDVVEGWTVTNAVDEGTVTVTAPPTLTSLVVVVLSALLVCEEAVELEGWTVTYAVDEGTVTVTAAAFPTDELDKVVVTELELALPAPLAVPVASTELELASSGTSPKAATTLLLSKQPTCTPVVVFNGMAAHTWVPWQPGTDHDPELVQYAYSASIQA